MRMSVSRRILVGALSSTALGLGAAPALAQDAVATPTASDPVAAAAESAPVNPNEIIVTARRRNETLQTTPIAITAINAAMLQNKGSTNIRDLEAQAPNLLISQQTAGSQAANLSIRGLTYADIEKAQEPAVGVVIDGVVVGTSTGQLLDLFDIDQIEVLRGPQGTLFGRNTIGGVISIRRSRPTMHTGAKIEATYGNYNSYSGRGIVNLGVGDWLGVKGFYFHNQTDGYLHNAITGKRTGGSNNENYGAAFLVKPPGSNIDFLLTVEKQDQQFTPANGNIARTGDLVCAFAPATECNRNTRDDIYTVFVRPAHSSYKAPSVTGELNWKLGGVKITSITAYRESKELQTQDFDATSAEVYVARRKQDYHQFSQELRFAGNLTPTFDYVVGGYYFKSQYNLEQYTCFLCTLLAPNLTIIDGYTYDANAQLVTGQNRSAALFGDFNWAFAPKFRLSFGGRYTKDKKSLRNAYALDGLLGAGSATFNKFTPKIGIDYRPNADTMLYASWSRGYRSGGFSPRAATAITAAKAYQPETVDSFEVGAKLDLLDRRLQFNVAAFYSKYNDLQQNTTIAGGPTGNQTITDNAGKATIKGLEFDANFRATQHLRFTATLGVLRSKFNEYMVPGVSPITGSPVSPITGNPVIFDYSRNRLIYTPKLSGSVGAEYKTQTSFGEITANLNYRYISPYDEQISLGPISGDLTNGPIIVNGNDPRVRSDKQNLIDAALTARFKMSGADFYATLWGRNLLDDRGPVSNFTAAGLIAFSSAREPRTYGVTVGTKF